MKSAKMRNISILRGLILCYIVMGHIGFTGNFDYYIHAFHVPIFYIISGYCFQPSANAKEYLKKKVRKMLIPYLGFSLIHFILAFF